MVTFNLAEDHQQPPPPPPGSRLAPNSNEISGIFSVLSNRPPYSSASHVRWPSFSVGNGRSFWTKYCILCTVCGSAATILAGIFLVVAALFRYYTTSIYYFETVPTYIPAILLSICGVSTIAFSCKRNRNIILLRITACWSLCSAALSSVITITTSLIHMNRLQTLKECVYNKNPPSCTCFAHAFGIGPGAPDTVHYIFENTPDCDVIHGILYSCLRAVFAISVVAVLLSIFLCMLLYQLIGHERKKAYWSRIRRINSDWSADFIACLGRPMPRDRSVLPLVMSPSGTMSMGPSSSILPPAGWGPPPPYEEVADERPMPSNRSFLRPLFPHAAPSSNPNRVLRLVTSQSENSFRNSDGLISPHPFSPTITSIDPVSVFRQHQEISQSYAGRINNGSSGTIGGISDIMENHLSTSSALHGNLALMSGNSSRIAINMGNPSGQSQTSMSSITSLSIPDTMKSTNTNTPCDLSIAEVANEQDDPELSNSLDLLRESSSLLLLTETMSLNIIKDVATLGEGQLNPGINTTTNGKTPLVAVSEPKITMPNMLSNYYEDTSDKLDLLDSRLTRSSKSSFSKISSLPCSPLLNMKKRFWPGGHSNSKGKSVQNLTFSNFDYENLANCKKESFGNILNRRRLSRGKPESCLFIKDEVESIKDCRNNLINTDNDDVNVNLNDNNDTDDNSYSRDSRNSRGSKDSKNTKDLKGSSLPSTPQKVPTSTGLAKCNEEI